MRGSLVLVALVSSVVGVLEAAVLVIVATVAASLTSTTAAAPSLGPLSLGDLSQTTLLWIGVAIVPVTLALQVFSGWAIARMFARGVHGARMSLVEAHAHAAWPAKEALSSSTFIQLAHSNVSKIGDSLVAAGALTAASANFAALVASAVVIDPAAALAILLGVGGLLAVVAPLLRAARRQQRGMVELNRAYSASLHVYAALGREIEVFGVQDNSIAAIRDHSIEQGHALRRARLISTVSTALFKSAGLLLILGVLAAVRWSGTEQVATFAAIALVLLRSVTYGQAIQSSMHAVAESSSWIDDLTARVGELTESRDGHRSVGRQSRFRLAPGEPIDLRLDQVDFSYVPGRPVFADLTLEVAAGEYVGLAGSSGAGKTTLAELLLGLRSPSRGTVLASGIDLASIDPAMWARSVAFVPQEPVLASGTILENVRFYRPWVSDEEVEASLEAANVLHDARQWSDGIRTDVGALGGKLSGGQRQRIAIARALVGRPGLIVLDEPTSALDEHSESRVAETLAAVRGTVTVVVIAHRLSTLQRCDRVVVLGDGGVQANAAPGALGDLRRLLEDSR